MSEINIKIEGVSYKVEEGLTILEAAKKCGYEFRPFVHTITVNVQEVPAAYVSLRQPGQEVL